MISFVLRRRLPKFMALSKLASPQDTVVFEDGIIHNNGGLTHDYLKKQPVSFKPDVILHLEADVEYVLENRLNRLREGRGTFMERGLSQEELRELSRKSNGRYQRRVEFLVDSGTDLYTIDVQAGDTQVAQSIRSALNAIEEHRA